MKKKISLLVCICFVFCILSAVIITGINKSDSNVSSTGLNATLSPTATPSANINPTVTPRATEKNNAIVFNPEQYYDRVNKIIITDNEIPNIVLTKKEVIAEYKNCITGTLTEGAVERAVGCNFSVSFYDGDTLLFSLLNANGNSFYLDATGYEDSRKHCDNYNLTDSETVAFKTNTFTTKDLRDIACKYSKTYRDYRAGLVQFDEETIMNDIIEE